MATYNVNWQGAKITQDAEHRLVTDTQINTWNSKANGYHTHTKSQITDFPSSLKNPNSIKIQLNGGTTEGTNQFTYDGSGAKSLNITAALVGAATSGHNHDGVYSKLGHTHTKSEITDFPTIPTTLKNPNSIVIKLNGGSTEGTNMFTYDGAAAKSINITPAGIGAAAASHTHTIAQVSNLQTTLDGKAPKSHTHGSADITALDASKITSGTISIDRLPKAALERLVPVTDSAARLKLTAADVQNGDTVKEEDTGLMYFVSDQTKLGTAQAADAFTPYTAGAASSVPWSGVTNKPATFTPSAHTHTRSQITDFPSSLKNPTSVKVQLNGGTQEGTTQFTYDGSAAKTINITAALVGAAASAHKHTKSEITDFPSTLKNPTAVKIQLNGGSTEGTNQFTYDGSTAKTINITAALVGAATSGHNHDGVYSKLGHTHTKSEITDFPTALKNPNSIIIKLNGGTAEGTSQFTYDGSGAKALNITPASIGAATSGHNHDSVYAKSSHTHSMSNIRNLESTLIGKATNSTLTSENLNSLTVPGFYSAGDSNIVTNKPNGVDTFGLIVVKAAIGNFYTQMCYDSSQNAAYIRYCNNGTWTNWDKQDFHNTWRGIQNNLTSDSTTESLSAAQGKELKRLVDGKAATSHTHTKSQITDFPASLKNPTSIVIKLNSGTTEGSNMFTYDGSGAKSINITPGAIGAAATSHTHTKSQITDFPTTLKNPTSIKIQLNGGTTEGTNQFTYDGSGAKNINITPGAIGAATSGHTHSQYVTKAPTLVTSWDAATEPGYYYAAKGATNAPEAANPYFGEVLRSATNTLQTLYREGTSGNIYKYFRRGTRNNSTGSVTWGDWALMELVIE